MDDPDSALFATLEVTRALVADAYHAAARDDIDARLRWLALGDALDRVLLVLPAYAAAKSARDGGAAVGPDALADAHAELARALERAAPSLDSSMLERLTAATAALELRVRRLRGPTRSARSVTPVDPARAAAPCAPRQSRADPGAGAAVGASTSPIACDSLRFGAAAPRAAAPGTTFIARFVAYASTDAPSAHDALQRDAPGAAAIDGVGSSKVARGTAVTVSLEAKGLKIEDDDRCVQDFVWDGELVKLLFAVTVPPDAAQAPALLKFNVMVEGLTLARVRLEVAVQTAAAHAEPAPALDAHQGVALARTAFASYASKDRDRVLDRVAAIRIAAGIDVFLDCRDLNPGEPWQPRLEQEIDRRDIFMLFWSAAAATSLWVTWEWERALDRKPAEQMQIHPLENGVPPPRRLKHLHLGDSYMDSHHVAKGMP